MNPKGVCFSIGGKTNGCIRQAVWSFSWHDLSPPALARPTAPGGASARGSSWPGRRRWSIGRTPGFAPQARAVRAHHTVTRDVSCLRILFREQQWERVLPHASFHIMGVHAQHDVWLDTTHPIVMDEAHPQINRFRNTSSTTVNHGQKATACPSLAPACRNCIDAPHRKRLSWALNRASSFITRAFRSLLLPIFLNASLAQLQFCPPHAPALERPPCKVVRACGPRQ